MPTSFAFTNALASSSPPSPKLNLSTGALPRYIAPTQPPTNKAPFAQIHATPFVASTTLHLPPELHTLLRPHLPAALLTPHHAHLHLTLTDLLTPPLLTNIQTPGTHISLLSSGTPGVDDARYLLRADGVLRLELSRERYERAGLAQHGGATRAVPSGGRKHVRDRFVVELDLRSAAMRQGKKGFERLRWAAREVLSERRAWLGVVWGGAERGVFEGLAPEWRGGVAEERVESACKVPVSLLTGAGRAEDEEDVWALVEWADLVALMSPRVKDGDVVDEFVSRYEVPGEGEGITSIHDVTVLRWTGLLSSRWVLDLLIELLKTSRTQKTGKDQWAMLSVTGHQTEAVGNIDGYHIFLQPERMENDANAESVGPEEAAARNNRASEVGEEGYKEDKMDIEESTASTVRAGFQRFMCMQFVDSVQV